jgi:hypothetical protein
MEKYYTLMHLSGKYLKVTCYVSLELLGSSSFGLISQEEN